MLQKIIDRRNTLIDWFIVDKNDLSKAKLFFRRRFVEAVFAVGLSLLVVSVLKFFGFRENYPSEIGLLIVALSLFLFRKYGNSFVAGNLLLAFIFGSLIYETLTYDQEIIPY